ncbi:MAG: substrate-binding domain-containing protein [Peptoniphilaceae bacterium]|nr:substrate-binding domain-containing protein [Peptoniphilaceae bacterium]MDY6085509.1 substrate-binding domain-containing protein [Peptoniphilaceae bacterium]
MNSTFKKILGALFAMILVVGLAACGNGNNSSTEAAGGDTSAAEETTAPAETSEEGAATGSLPNGEINVVSREEGSGTRGAFVEITGVEQDKTDNTYEGAIVQNGTDLVMTYVAGDARSIGYISLGSLNDTVKAVPVDGVEATEENVVNNTYALKRPFNIVYKEDKLTDLTKDFLAFIESKEAQDMAADAGVIAAFSDAKPYEGKDANLEGTIRVQGSTSVDPYMQKIEEAYKAIHTGVKFDHTANGSGAGIQAAIDDNADIGMASREVKQEELDQGLTAKAIAIDGICVIVAPENGVATLSMDQIKGIFTGEVRNWEDVAK